MMAAMTLLSMAPIEWAISLLPTPFYKTPLCNAVMPVSSTCYLTCGFVSDYPFCKIYLCV